MQNLKYPQRCAHELFQVQADLTPDASALIFQGEVTTYGALESCADRLAGELEARGLEREQLVGIYLRNTPQAILSLVAVLKTGAAFVPLDANHPPERIARILEDSRPAMVLTSSDLIGHLNGSASLKICVDDALNQSGLNGRRSRATTAYLDGAAAVIYTSGSTGVPKGVIRTHRGIVSRLAWTTLAADEICCHCMSLTYGLSQERLFLPLMYGRPLVIMQDDVIKDPRKVASFIVSNGITDITLVPALLRQLLACPADLRRCRLRTVAVGSAPLGPELIARFREVLPKAGLINAYGSSEAGSAIRGYVQDVDPTKPVPIGRPVAGCEAYILDPDLQPVTDGRMGEVFISGPSLARGYLFAPALTAASFVPNPHDSAGGRMYRTGDIGCYLPDGAIGLAGRADRRVKVRGFRVELGEIEQALRQHQAIDDCAITNREVNSDSWLTAYVVYRTEQSATVTELRQHLLKTLPDHMVPRTFVSLKSLPVNHAGKLDFAALPAFDMPRPDIATAYKPPDTPLKCALVGIWEERLGKRGLGTADSFIHVGGDSVMATDIALTIAETFEIPAPLTLLFEFPTIDELATYIENTRENMGGCDRLERLAPQTSHA